MGVFQDISKGCEIMAQDTANWTQKNRANILTGFNVVGTIVTAVLSAFGGAKSAREIDAESAKLQRPLTTKEKAKLCWKNFLPTAGVGAGSIGSGIASNRIMAGDIARLTTDVTLAHKAINEWKKASNEVLTEKQQNEIKEKIGENKLEKIPAEDIQNVQDLPSGGYGVTQLFVDGFNEEIKFFSTVDKVQLALSQLRTEMALLKPRDPHGHSPTVLGIPYVNWLYKIGWTNSTKAYRSDSTIIKNYGWNKGYMDDYGCCNDDEISAYLKPSETEWRGQMRSCYVIEWDTEPSDMKLGNILKSDIA